MGTVLKSEIGDEFAAKLKGLPSRPTSRRRCRFVKIAGNEVMERGELAGRYLQVVRVVGTELEIDGKSIYEGVVRHAKDPQKALNFYVSAQTEAIALTPKAPWLMAEGQDEGYEAEWETANTCARTRGFATSPSASTDSPPRLPSASWRRPTFRPFPRPSSPPTSSFPTRPAFTRRSLVRRPQSKAAGPFSRARARARRPTSTSPTTSRWPSGTRAAVLVDLIPKIYSGPRVMRILGEDGKQEMVPVNGAAGRVPRARTSRRSTINWTPAATTWPSPWGQATCPAGRRPPRRCSSSCAWSRKLGPSFPDLVVRAMDIPDGQQIAERLQKLLPPPIRPPDTEKQPPPAVLAQQLQQAMAQNQQLAQHLHALSQIAETKQQRARLEGADCHSSTPKSSS
jgi:hypothetical protein